MFVCEMLLFLVFLYFFFLKIYPLILERVRESVQVGGGAAGEEENLKQSPH